MLVKRNSPFPITGKFDSFDSLIKSLMADVFDSEGVWAPRVDIVEKEKEYMFLAELPGMDKKDIKLTIENNVLTMTGERKEEKMEKGAEFSRRERFVGKFERSFALPEDVDLDKVKAKMNNGVLEISIAKRPESLPRGIEINVG